jgi:hypothetical protein
MMIDFSWFCQDGQHVARPAIHVGRAGIVKHAFCPTCQRTTQQTVERSPITVLVAQPTGARAIENSA